MKYLNKLWVRVVISLVTGAVLSELFHIRNGHTQPHALNTITQMGAVFTFIFLSLIVFLNKLRHYFFPKKEEVENILDEELK